MTKNKYRIAEYINDNQANITSKCNEGMPVSAIAKLYNVTTSVIYLRLIKWGVTITCSNHRASHRKNEIPGKHYKRKFSPEFLARQKENTKINDGQIKYVKNFEQATEDQGLVENIINHPLLAI